MPVAFSGEDISKQLDAVLSTACRRVGLSDAQAKLLRVGTNALYHLVDSSIVVRIGLTPDAFPAADRETRVARWLASSKFPAARLIASVAQPIDVAGLPVTFWEWLTADADAPTAAALGATLGRLHDLPGGDIALGSFDPLASTLRLLDRTKPPDPTTHAYLREECATLDAEYRKLVFELPRGPIHGDAHAGNVLRCRGRSVLMDLETFAVGPREWDLVPTAVHHDRFGLSAGDYGSFSAAYGFDVRAWPGYRVLRRIREVSITAWLLIQAAYEPRAATEFRRRVASLQDDCHTEPWHPH